MNEELPAGHQRPVPRVLVVEDDPMVSKVLVEGLRRAGCEVALVEKGDIALMTAIAVDPHLILLDWMLPGRAGVEVCREVRRTERVKDVPIVMLTTLHEEERVTEGFEAGADDYLTKPFHIDEVTALVDEYVNI